MREPDPALIIRLNSLLITMIKLYQMIVNEQSETIFQTMKHHNDVDKLLEISKKHEEIFRERLTKIDELIDIFKAEAPNLFPKEIIH